ncbi:MAG: carboxypeptidase-like regulatory domain-containing protein [Bacteroidetes bacterium]|nr:carboxypeptidase-like regulatory domain-containing protein [Bacteroidota bacterium]
MRINAYFFVLLVLLFTFSDIKAQKHEKKPVQFSGVVVSSDSLKPISFTNIVIERLHKGTTADYNGFFSLIAYPGDVIIFSAISYKRVYFRIPDSLTSDRYSLIQSLTADTVMLAGTVIHPWPSREQFKQAFIALKMPKDDDFQIAMKNLAIEDLKMRIREYKMDGSMNYRNYIDQQVNKLYYAGQLPPNNLLNPIAWAQFIKAWQNGDFKKKD